MYAAQPWTIRQYAGFSTAEDSNAFYRRNLAAGQKGLSIAFDLATHRGYDSDHPRVSGDVGMAGVAIDSIYDMRTLFSGIPLDQISVSMTMNGAVLPVLALYIVAAEEQGVPHAKLSGTIQNDILKEFMVRNTYIYPPGPSLRIISDIFAYTSAEMPKFNSISVSGYHMQEAGATQDLELAYTLADGVEYVRAGLKAGLHRRSVRPACFVLLGDRDELFHGDRQASCGPHAVGKIDEAVQAGRFAFVVVAHALPNVRLVFGRAGCVQQCFPHYDRSNGCNSRPDPVVAYQCARRGSRAADRFFCAHRPQHAVVATSRRQALPGSSIRGAALTMSSGLVSLARKAWKHIEEVEGMGGMAKAIEAGIPKLRIEEAAAKTQARIDAGAQSVIGVNKYPPTDEEPIEVLKIDNSAVRQTQLDKLARLKAERDPAALQEALDALTRAASRGNGNLLELAIEAARAKATVGEISLALEKVFGRHRAEIKAITGVYKREVGMTGAVERNSRFRRNLRSGGRPSPSPPGRQNRPGWTRPWTEGHRIRFCGSRVRRRHRAFVRDARRGRAPSGRK